MVNNHTFGSVLAYFACGPILSIPIGNFRPYDTVVLVDRNLALDRLHLHPDRDELLSERFILLETDSIVAVDILQWMGVRLDAYLAWNEGIFEGGGDYHLNGRFFLKYLSRILPNCYTHVHNEHYFPMRQRKNGFPILPFVRSVSNGSQFDDLRSILCMFFTANHWNAQDAQIHSMERHERIPIYDSAPLPNVFLKWGNIWDDAELDMIFIPMKWLPCNYIFMRRPDPFGPGYLPGASAPWIRFPGKSKIRPVQWGGPRLESALMSSYLKRFGLDDQGISDRVLDTIASSRNGSRIGLMDWGHRSDDIEKLSRAASSSGSSIYIFRI
jgi:hypothetical protein